MILEVFFILAFFIVPLKISAIFKIVFSIAMCVYCVINIKKLKILNEHNSF